MTSGFMSAQTKTTVKPKEVDAYVTYVMGSVARIEVPSTKQLFFFGRSFTNPDKGVWYLCSDSNLIRKIEEITKNGDTAVLVGAELSPYQIFTPKQWKKMPKSAKKAFSQEAHGKLSSVNCAVLSSVHKYTGGESQSSLSVTQRQSDNTTPNRKQENGVWYREVILPNGMKVWQKE